MTALDIINRADFFKGVSEKNRALAASICIPKKLKKREDLFHEGEKGFGVHLCGEGSIQVYKTGRDGKETVIKIIEPGEIFGEVVLFENSLYPATATALTPALVYVMPKQDFHGLLENPAFRTDFIGMLMRKQRYLAEQIFALSSQTVDERLLRFLSKRQIPGNRPISKKDIAAAIGVTPESLSRALAALKRKGVVEEKGREIRLNPVKS